MLTNLPEDETVLFHPIVFFDQGTCFFETRRWLDGDALLRCGLAGRIRGSNHTVEESELLVLDPMEPLRRLDATWTSAGRPGNGKPGHGSRGSGWTVHCSAIARGSWGLLAVMGPGEIARVQAAAGELPRRRPGFGAEEWLLRHAFSDERARGNSFLAATLARLPILFARAQEGEIHFQLPSYDTGMWEPRCEIHAGDCSAGAFRAIAGRDWWLVAVVDTDGHG